MRRPNGANPLHRSIYKELDAVRKKEDALRRKAMAPSPKYKELISERIPRDVVKTLNDGFTRAFEIIFRQGTGIIEKSYSKDGITADYDIRDYAVGRKCTRKEIIKLKRSADRADFLNMALTTVEGVGLGLLGVGLPDIVLFLGVILKGVYETSLHYGYDYDSTFERYLILKMMAASLSVGEIRERLNFEVDELLVKRRDVSENEVSDEIGAVSQIFATDMTVQKFIQGLPVIGVVGGALNPVYYGRILSYVKLKYYKRYLYDKLARA